MQQKLSLLWDCQHRCASCWRKTEKTRRGSGSAQAAQAYVNSCLCEFLFAVTLERDPLASKTLAELLH